MVLVGAVLECLAAFETLVVSPDCELVAVVTLTPEAARGVSGAVELASVAEARGVKAIQVADINAPESVDEIRAMEPDLIAVVGWTRLIHDELLSIPPRGCIGFHASLLPHNRGRAPVNWAILRGETETGNTLMVLNAGVDTGLIIDQRSTPISLEDDCATVYERIAILGAEMLRDNLGPLLRGEVVLRPQDESRASLLPKRVPAMGVIDWSRSAREIHDWIRAQTYPYPGAFTRLHGGNVSVWASYVPSLEVEKPTAADPGTVLTIEPEGIRVSTGAGVIRVARMGAADAPYSSAWEWAAVVGVEVGARFDQPSYEMVQWSLGLGPRPEESKQWA